MIKITGWRKGYDTIAFVKLLMEQKNYGLIESKIIAEKVLAGEVIEVFSERINQVKLLTAMDQIGIEAHIVN